MSLGKNSLGNGAFVVVEAKVEELIKESGAKVIVSGAGVGQMALQFCNRNEIMVLKIASQFELDCFCRTTDAVALWKLKSTVDPSDLGFVDSISVEKAPCARVTVTNERGGVVTVLLGVEAGNIISDEQLERAVLNIVNTYKALCRDSRIVPGAGATEIEIARRLKKFAFRESGSSDQLAIAKYAESFELIPKTLAHNAYLHVEGIIKTLYADHAAGNVKVGIDLKDKDCKDASTLNIWDLYTIKCQALQYATDAVCNALRVDQDREPQSMFDRLIAECRVSGEPLSAHEVPTVEINSIFYASIWTNNLQPKRETEMLAVKRHGDTLFGLSSDGTLSSFDIRSSEVCWSIPTDSALDLDLSYKSSDCSYFVDSSRVFMHTKGTKPPVGFFRYHKFEFFEKPIKCYVEDIIPSRLVTHIYVDPVKGCCISPLRSDCKEILCIRAICGQIVGYEPGTSIILWYERVATFDILLVCLEEAVQLQKQLEQLQSFRRMVSWEVEAGNWKYVP